MEGRLLLSCSCGNCDGEVCCFIWCKLPIDMIMEVLCHLPDKPLIQFKCVSKAWNSFIANFCVPRLAASAPLSALIFRRQSISNGYDVITSQGHKDTRFLTSCIKTFPFPRVRENNIDIIGCFDGLVLMSRRVRPKKFYVYNPVTGQCVSIPVNPNHRADSFMGLAFNPKKNTYKIIRTPRACESASLVSALEVFSSATGKWGSCRILLKPGIIGNKWLCRSVYLNENFYVLSSSRHLICFDLHGTDDEKLGASAIKLPVKTSMGDDRQMGSISLSNESLYYSRVDKSILRIWSLELGISQATSSWVRTCSVSMEELRRLPYGELLSPPSIPFVIDPASGFIYIGSSHVVLRYNLWTNKLELFHQTNEDERILNGKSCFRPYRKSLVIIPDFIA